MKNHVAKALLICAGLLATYPAIAQNTVTALVPLPSLDDLAKGEDGWADGLGLGVEYYSSEVRKSPIARSDYEAEVGIGFIYMF